MKLRAITILLLCLSATSFAQIRERGTVELTPNAGLSSSTLLGNDTNNVSRRNGFQAGMTIDIYFNDRWSFRTGGSFMSMGANDIHNVEGVTIETVLDYLHIPLNANWHFGSTRKWNLNFGMSPGFLATADVDGADGGEFLKSFQLAFNYGIGYKIEVSDSFSILLDASGIIGLTNIFKEEILGNNTNAGGSLNVGAVFKL